MLYSLDNMHYRETLGFVNLQTIRISIGSGVRELSRTTTFPVTKIFEMCLLMGQIPLTGFRRVASTRRHVHMSATGVTGISESTGWYMCILKR